MLDRELLILAIDIHSGSYRLLQWIGTAVENGELPVGRMQQHSETPDAAIDWVSQTYLLFPVDIQPDPAHLREFGSFFWTYVTTSFDVVEKPGIRLEPGVCGCLCPLCARIKNAPHLRPKKLTKADKRRAVELMVDRVVSLAHEEGLACSPDRAQKIVADLKTRRAAGYSAYGFWLINRLRGYTDGPSVLALWREIAWNREGSPIQGFKLRYEDFELAEKSLIEALRNASERDTANSQIRVHIQLQPDLSPELDVAAAVTHLKRIGEQAAAQVRVTEGVDRGQFINVDFTVADALALWTAIREALRSVPGLSDTAIVCCQGVRGWDDYRLLYHFDPTEPLDPLE